MRKMEQRQRLDRVESLLLRGTDLKTWSGREPTQEAKEAFLQAYDLARQDPALPEPYPQLAAYRFAHLHLRAGELTEETLKNVDSLLQEAERARALGMYPLAYRLAVMHRLKASPEDAAAVFREARARLLDRPAAPTRAGIQSPEHNLIELASYFWGTPYVGHLDGLGGQQWLSHYKDTQAWTVMGEGLPRLPCSRAAAVAEIEAMAGQTGQEVILLYFGPKDARLVNASRRESVPDEAERVLQFVSLLVENPGIDSGKGREMLGVTDNYYRQLRSGLRRSLKELTAPESPLQGELLKTTGRSDRLGVKVLGAVALSKLTWPEV